MFASYVQAMGLKQASCLPAEVSVGGAFILHISLAFAHLGLKAHPFGGFSGDGSSPVRVIRFLRVAGLIVGVADSSAAV